MIAQYEKDIAMVLIKFGTMPCMGRCSTECILYDGSTRVNDYDVRSKAYQYLISKNYSTSEELFEYLL